MIFTSSGSVYSKVQFKTEDEVEKVVVNNFRLLFGDYSILLPKSLIRTSGGKGTVPDGIIVDFKGNRWFILEVERGDHETWGHIAPQISKQLVAVMSRETKNKIVELCIAEIGKQKEFSKLLESDLKIQLIHIHGFVQKILERDPIVSLPIDYSPSDLEEWASMQKVDVQIQHIEKYMNGKGEELYDFPDLELTQEKESLKTMNKSNALYEIVKAGLLNVGDIVHFDYGPKGKSKTHFEGKICSDGIEVDGVVSSASISALRCIQQISTSRTTTNGWLTWKTADGKFLEEKWNALLKLNGEEVKPSKKNGKKKHSGAKFAKKKDDNLFYHYAKGGSLTATMKKDGDSFVILAGSKMSLDYQFRGSGWMEVRKNANVSSSGELRSDIECSSASMAAALVAGGPRDGLLFWRNKNGKKLKELE